MAAIQSRNTRAPLNFTTELESPSTIRSVFTKEDRMIARIWHRYTKPEHANAYESMLKPELLPGISKVKGYRGSYLLRREAGAEVEFITIMLWDSIDAIRAVAGEDYETAVIPEEQRKYSTTMLNRCITKSRQSTSPPRCHRFHSEDGYWRSHKPPRHSFPLISGVTPDFVNYSLLSDSYSVHRGDNFRVACQPGCSPELVSVHSSA